MEPKNVKIVDMTSNTQDDLLEKASEEFCKNAIHMFKSGFGDVVAAAGPFPPEIDLTELWHHYLKSSGENLVNIIAKLLQEKAKLEQISLIDAKEPGKSCQQVKLSFYRDKK